MKNELSVCVCVCVCVRMCCVCRRLCALTLWIRVVQLTTWLSLTSLCPPSPLHHHASDHPVYTHWNIHTPRGSSHARATAGATVKPLGKNMYLSNPSVAHRQRQMWRVGLSARRACPVWRFPVLKLHCQCRSVAPKWPALAPALTLDPC